MPAMQSRGAGPSGTSGLLAGLDVSPPTRCQGIGAPVLCNPYARHSLGVSLATHDGSQHHHTHRQKGSNQCTSPECSGRRWWRVRSPPQARRPVSQARRRRQRPRRPRRRRPRRPRRKRPRRPNRNRQRNTPVPTWGRLRKAAPPPERAPARAPATPAPARAPPTSDRGSSLARSTARSTVSSPSTAGCGSRSAAAARA